MRFSDEDISSIFWKEKLLTFSGSHNRNNRIYNLILENEMGKAQKQVNLNDLDTQAAHICIEKDGHYFDFCINKLKLQKIYQRSDFIIISPKYLLINETYDDFQLLELK